MGGSRREVATASDRGRSGARASPKFGAFFPACLALDVFGRAGPVAWGDRGFIFGGRAAHAAASPRTLINAKIAFSAPGRTGNNGGKTVAPPPECKLAEAPILALQPAGAV